MRQTGKWMMVGVLLAFATADARAQGATDIGASIDISSYRLNPPVYPREAIEACVAGTAVLLIDIDKDGQRSQAVVERSSGYAYFDQAAIEASKRWKYNPATENDQRVPGKVRIPVDFAEYDGCWTAAPDVEARLAAASLKEHPPKWPAIVAEQHLSGLVVLLIQVDKDGTRKNVKVGVSSGDHDIDQAAMLAALDWEFQPATLKGKPVRSLLQLPLPYGQQEAR